MLVYTPRERGITPAYAGKSIDTACRRAGWWDHPRLCGEKEPSDRMLSIPTGSPPPMRGKATARGHAKKSAGITPAYAGKSSLVADTQRRRQDHPRLCGEKVFILSFPPYSRGSPPPMRGKDGENVVMQGYPGITPAYAGKSSYDFSRFFFV